MTRLLGLLIAALLFSSSTAQASFNRASANRASPRNRNPARNRAFARQSVPHFKRAVVIIFENTNYSQTIAQPFFAQLAREGALLTRFSAETHPSLPNYIALVGGDTLGVNSDSDFDLKDTNLADLIEKSGKHWKVYAEGVPGNCFTGTTHGAYARRHEPFISFLDIQKNPARCSNIVAGREFFVNARDHRLPDFSLYVPDVNNDGHDTNVAFADRWFRQTFGRLLHDRSFLKDTLVVVTFDENDYKTPHNQVYTVLLGSPVIPGSRSSGEYSHYSILKTLELGLGLGSLHRNDAKARAITGIWK